MVVVRLMPLYCKRLGIVPVQSGEAVVCSQQGNGRPCAGTFGFVSYADNVTWQISLDMPQGYRATSPAIQEVRSGNGNQMVDFGIVPLVIPPLDTTNTVYNITPGVLGDPVAGASARMVRDAGGFSITFDTATLPVGHVVTLWAYTFNNPIACNAPCDVDDMFINGAPGMLYTNPDGTVGRPGTDFSLMGLGGHVIETSGRATFTGRIDINTAPPSGVWQWLA